MNGIEFAVFVAFVIAALVLILWLFYKRMRSSFGVELHVIPEMERWVIFRDGAFSRLAGPGTTAIQTRRFDIPSFESIEYERVAQVINVRNQDVNIYIPELYMYGVPYGFTLNLWCRTDLQEAARITGRRLSDLAQFSDAERRKQLVDKTRDALVAAGQEIQARHSLKDDDLFIAKLMPILPGVDLNYELLDSTADRLAQSLPTVGIVLDSTQPLLVTKIHLEDKLVNSFSRGRMLTLLQEHVPSISEDRLLELIASSEDFSQHRVYRMHIDDGGEQKEMQQDFAVDEDGEAKMRIRRRIPPSLTNVDQGVRPTEEEATPVVAVPSDGDYEMTPEDYRVLKRVPVANSLSDSKKAG